MGQYRVSLWLRARRSGFTIVELLIVVVVIALLAAITIVAYNGVTRQAAEALVQSDVKNATTQLELDRLDNDDRYPGSQNAAGGGRGLSASGGNTIKYSYDPARNAYCITVKSSSPGVESYMASSDNRVPRKGACPGHGDELLGSIELEAFSGIGHFGPTDIQGNYYTTGDFSMYQYNAVVKTTSAGAESLYAGSSEAGHVDGDAQSARFENVYGVTVDSSGVVYVAEGVEGGGMQQCRIRRIATPSAAVSTVSIVNGGCPIYANAMGRNVPIGSDGSIYLWQDSCIKRVSQSGAVAILAGVCGNSADHSIVDGTGGGARLSGYLFHGITIDADSNIYTLEEDMWQVEKGTPGDLFLRRVSPSGIVTTIARYQYPETENLDMEQMWYITGIHFNDQSRKVLYITDGCTRGC